MSEMKSTVYVPFGILPEPKDWKVGGVYRVKMVLRQRSLDENGASFEIVDATSLEGDRKKQPVLSSEGGTYRGA